MAGVVPFSNGPPGRKQWNIRDKRTVKRLRSQLAEDGCPESQLVLAKQLLQEKSSTNDRDNEENARLGVFWLMQASQQGCQEATEMLQACLDSGEGITEHNYLDVKACLNTSLNEKLARRAAREMFLSLSAGQDFITTEQLRRIMDRLDGTSVQRGEGTSDPANRLADGTPESEGWKTRSEHWGEKLTEDHLEEAAATYSRGELPLVQRVLSLTDPQQREISELPYLHRTVRHPFRTLRYAYTSLLDFAWNFAYPQTTVFLLLLFLSPLDSIIMVIPMILFHGSFLIMVISSLQMLQTKRDYGHFRVWSQLFLSYDRDGHLNTEDPEFVYIKKNLRPYGIFFLSLLIHLGIYHLVSEMWIPQSELAVLSFSLTFTTLFHFSHGFDFLMLLSFGLHVLAKYPYESDGVVRQTWRFLDQLPSFASQVVGSGVEFCLNFRGVFYLLIPGIFIKMASREAWRGTYKFLIPHCVTLAWWQIAVISCQGATLYGLIRSTLALVGMVLFLPIVSLGILILPVFAVFDKVTEPGLTPVTLTTTVIAASLIVIGIAVSKQRMQYLSKIQIVLAVAASFVLLLPAVTEFITPSELPVDMHVQSTLTYDQFISVCQKGPFRLKTTSADVQTQCLHLSGLPVNWEGVVDDVKITAVHNPVAKTLDYFPEPLKSRLTCWYGEKYDDRCDSLKNVCELTKRLRPIGQRCHVASLNKYDFEISLRVESSQWFGVEPAITLLADDSLRNVTLHLRPKDRIWFIGILPETETLGPNVRVLADEIGCSTCEDRGVLSSIKRERKAAVAIDQLYKGFNRVLNFLFSPVIVFH